MPKVSLIIPIYNTEIYLRKCLDSVINQTLHDIEIITVNDGSTDNSQLIIEEYASKDNRIKTITKDNEGLSIARNTGLSKATGEYIAFHDSDDFIKLDMLEKLYNKVMATQADIVMCDCFNYFADKDEVNLKYRLKELAEALQTTSISTIEYKNEIINMTSVWTKLFKKSFLVENNLKFPEGLSFEDNLFNYQTIVLASKIEIVPEGLYYYRQSSSSITQRKGRIRFDALEIYKKIEAFLRETNNYNNYKDSFKKRLVSDCFIHLRRIHDDYKKEFFEGFRELLKGYSHRELILSGKKTYIKLLLVKCRIYLSCLCKESKNTT